VHALAVILHMSEVAQGQGGVMPKCWGSPVHCTDCGDRRDTDEDSVDSTDSVGSPDEEDDGRDGQTRAGSPCDCVPERRLHLQAQTGPSSMNWPGLGSERDTGTRHLCGSDVDSIMATAAMIGPSMSPCSPRGSERGCVLAPTPSPSHPLAPLRAPQPPESDSSTSMDTESEGSPRSSSGRRAASRRKGSSCQTVAAPLVAKCEVRRRRGEDDVDDDGDALGVCSGEDPEFLWQDLAGVIQRQGQGPEWRRRPCVGEDGRTVTPPKTSKLAPIRLHRVGHHALPLACLQMGRGGAWRRCWRPPLPQ
jgi:hypothetical protein